MDLQGILEANGWKVLGPVANVQRALRLLEAQLPSVSILDVNLGHELVTPVAEYLQQHGVPFAVASAYDQPERVGGAALAGVPNVGKPTAMKRLFTVLADLTI